jgi:hypothetical protein
MVSPLGRVGAAIFDNLGGESVAMQVDKEM